MWKIFEIKSSPNSRQTHSGRERDIYKFTAHKNNGYLCMCNYKIFWATNQNLFARKPFLGVMFLVQQFKDPIEETERRNG